jgi:non-homologous end joining protein Ku
MASPRSMWSGTISLGLLSLPVTIGKSWADEREPSLRDLCAIHGVPVDRTERCSTDADWPEKIRTIIGTKSKDKSKLDHIAGLTECDLAGGKQKGVQLDSGEWRKLNENEYARIEEATKSDSLDILDVQPAYDLPLTYGTGTYYVRHNTKAKGVNADAFAHFVAALQAKDLGAVVKWCKSARQKLAILHTDAEGHLLLTTVPFVSEWREPGQQENEHLSVEVQKSVVEQMLGLLDAISSKSFDHAAYSDEGLRLRSEAVEKILGGEKLQDKGEQKSEEKGKVPDLMAQLQASIEATKLSEKEKA